MSKEVDTINNRDYGSLDLSLSSSSGADSESVECIYQNLPENSNVGVRYHVGANISLVTEPRQPYQPHRNRILRWANAILFTSITMIALVSLVLIVVFNFFVGDDEDIYSIDIFNITPYTIDLGLYFLIIIFVIVPSSLLIRFRASHEEIISCCSVKCTLYVATIIAASFAFLGSSFVGLMQIFLTTECVKYDHTDDVVKIKVPVQYPIGSIVSALNLLLAMLCLLVSIFTVVTCYKDRSRHVSNQCLGVFVLQMLIIISNLLAFALSIYYVLILLTILTLSASVIIAFVIFAFLLCSSTAGPILCLLEKNGYRNFNQVSGIYTIVVSAFTVVGNIIAGVLIIVSTIITLTSSSSIDYDYDNCSVWHLSAILAWALITGFMNFFVVCIGILSFCFGCYSLHVCPRFLDCMRTVLSYFH